MVDLGQLTLRERVDAKKISWNSDSLKWSVSDFSIRQFDQKGLETDVRIGTNDSLINLGFIPADIQHQARKPDELDYYKLTERIIQLKENGVDSTKWEVDRYFKISFAFTNFIIVLFGIPLVVVRPKGGLSFGAGMGIFVIFIYYVFIKLGMSIGYNGITSPIVAAWMGNVLFFIGGILLLVFVRK